MGAKLLYEKVKFKSLTQRLIYFIIINYNVICMEMETTFKVKVRRIGSSLGVLIPKQMIEKKKIKEGEEIEISLLKRRKDLITKAFGIAKGAAPFIRENVDRV